MHNYLSVPRISRALAVLLACLLAAPVQGQTPPATTAPREINILILEGEGAINNVRQRVAREAMVQVEDENHKPVAAAAVTFFMPGDGASGVFTNGSRSITVLTDSEGKAAVRGIHLNKVQGKLQMRVQANYQGLTNNAVITQTNTIGAAAAREERSPASFWRSFWSVRLERWRVESQSPTAAGVRRQHRPRQR